MMVQRPSAHQDSPQRAAEEPASDLAPRPRGPQVDSGGTRGHLQRKIDPGCGGPPRTYMFRSGGARTVRKSRKVIMASTQYLSWRSFRSVA